MSIFKRISDIISANLNEMVDQAENPEPMLKQALREMEEQISEAKRKTAESMASAKMLGARLADHQTKEEQTRLEAESCVDKGDEAGARTALQRRREHQKLVAALQDELNATNEAVTTLRHQLEGMQVREAEARRSLATLSARHRAAKIRQDEAMPELRTDAFSKFERLSEKVRRAEAEAEAMRELSGVNETTTPSIKSASADPGIEAELQEMKSRLSK